METSELNDDGKQEFTTDQIYQKWFQIQRTDRDILNHIIINIEQIKDIATETNLKLSTQIEQLKKTQQDLQKIDSYLSQSTKSLLSHR